MKSRLKLAGLSAALVTTAAVQAEVKINENLAFDGYVIGAGVLTEGTPAKNEVIVGKSVGGTDWLFNSAFVGITGSYQAFTGRLSLLAINPLDNSGSGPTDSTGVLDAYVSYKIESLTLTAGKYLGWLGYESFHSPNNAFISFSNVAYNSPFSTGVKADYAGEGFSTGISARDSQVRGGSGFFAGDGEFADDVGYEAYFLFTGVKDLTLFAGLGYEDEETAGSILSTDFWASYNITEKLSIAGEFAALEDTTESSWLTQVGYKITDKLAAAARVTYIDGKGGADAVGYGVASTYTFTPNFSLKGEITKSDTNLGPDPLTYALQGLFRF